MRKSKFNVRRHVSFANVIASMALFLALGGVSYAAVTTLPANSVGSSQIKSAAVTSSKVKDQSLLATDFKAGQLPSGTPGPQGEKGATGATGPQGDKGATGAIGPQGDKGAPGAIGPQGDKGASGAIGPQGDKGVTGAVGPQGDKGATGVEGPRGEKGATGADGARGEKGATGADGARGEKGATGAQGEVGPKGDRGLEGPQGPKGDTGASGAPGGQGAKGDTGATGPQGLKGDTGATGATGPQGPAGAVNSYQVIASARQNVAPGARAEAIAWCPAGTSALGGGVSSGDGAEIDPIMTKSLPYDDGNGHVSWIGEIHNVSNTAERFTVYAVCGTATP